MGQPKGYEQLASSPLRKNVNQKGPATVSLSAVSASPSRSPSYSSSFDHDMTDVFLAAATSSVKATVKNKDGGLGFQDIVREDGGIDLGLAGEVNVDGVGQFRVEMQHTINNDTNTSTKSKVTGTLSGAGAGGGASRDEVEGGGVKEIPVAAVQEIPNTTSAEDNSDGKTVGKKDVVDLAKVVEPVPGTPKIYLGSKIEKISDPGKLDSPRMPVARINAIWNKWLNAYAGSSQYVEAAVHRHYVTERDIPDLIVCTQDSEYKATWKIIFGGFPGRNNAGTTGPMETQWNPIRDCMKSVCVRHKPEQSPTHAITAFGRWVRFWEVQEDGNLFPVTLTKSEPAAAPTAGPNIPKEQVYSSLDIGDEECVRVINDYMQSIFS